LGARGSSWLKLSRLGKLLWGYSLLFNIKVNIFFYFLGFWDFLASFGNINPSRFFSNRFFREIFSVRFCGHGAFGDVFGVRFRIRGLYVERSRGIRGELGGSVGDIVQRGLIKQEGRYLAACSSV